MGTVNNTTPNMASNQAQNPNPSNLDIILNHYANLNQVWTDNTYQLFIDAVYKNLDLIAAIPKKILVNKLISFKNQEALSNLRREIFAYLVKTQKNENYELTNRTKIYDDIYLIIHCLVSNAVLSEVEWLKFSKKTNTKRKNSSDIEMDSDCNNDKSEEDNEIIVELMNEVCDLKSLITVQGSKLDDLNSTLITNSNKLDAVLSIMQDLIKENKELKSIVNNLKQQQTYITCNDTSSKSTNNNANQTPGSLIKKALQQPQGNTNNYNNFQSPRNMPQKQSFVNTLKMNNNQAVNYNCKSTQQTLRAYDSSNPSLPNMDIDDPNNEYNGPWTVASGKPKKHQLPASKYIKSLGTSEASTSLVAPRMQKVFIGNCNLTTNVESITTFLQAITCDQSPDKKLPFQEIEEVSIKSTRIKAFTFFIPFQLRDIVTDTTKWPRGMRVDFSHRPRPATVIPATITQSTTN
jgi:hypothetical protein